MAEKWKPVVGYEGLYEVSSNGRIASLHGRKRTLLKPVRQPKEKGGYDTIGLSRDGRLKGFSVHALVAEAFIGPRPRGKVVGHLNGTPWDNRVSNLVYITHAEATALGNKSKLSEGAVRTIRRRLERGDRVDAIARAYGVSDVTIYNIKNGKVWSWVK